MARRKKTNSEEEAQPKKKNESLLDQTLKLAEHFISYFELLFIYYQKLLSKKVQRGFILTVAILYAVFLKVVGTVLIIIAGYFYFLNVYANNHVYTSLTLGCITLFLAFLILIVSIKKIS